MHLHPLIATLILALPTVHASEGGGLVFSGDLTREFHLKPGETAEGRLMITNASKEPRSARLYQTDYAMDGTEAVYGEPGHAPRSNAQWIEIAERQPELQPGETRSVAFRINAPADQGLRGTYWSIIMIEPLSIEAPREANDNRVSIRTITRYGIQIVAHVAGAAASKPTISQQEITVEDGKKFLRFAITNPGERWLRPKIEVRLFDQAGRPVTTLPAQNARLFPGFSLRQRFDLSGLAAGQYLAFVVMDTEDQLYGAQYRFQLEN